MSAVSSQAKQCLQRLLRDLREVQQSPLATVTAAPLESNLMEWHINAKAPDTSPMAGAVLHMVLRMRESYPVRPPTLYICTSLPHMNVYDPNNGRPGAAGTGTLELWERFTINGQHVFRICMDMLELPHDSVEWEYSGWSSAFSVQSILTQLQAFLADESLWSEEASHTHTTFEQALASAEAFECSCGHGVREAEGSAPAVWPAFPDTTEAPVSIHPAIVSMLEARGLRSQHANASSASIVGATVQRTWKAKSTTAESHASTVPANSTSLKPTGPVATAGHLSKSVADKTTATSTADDAWRVVPCRGRRDKSTIAKGLTHKPSTSHALTNPFSVLEEPVQSAQSDSPDAKPPTAITPCPAASQYGSSIKLQLAQALHARGVTPEAWHQMSTTARRNLRRRALKHTSSTTASLTKPIGHSDAAGAETGPKYSSHKQPSQNIAQKLSTPAGSTPSQWTTVGRADALTNLSTEPTGPGCLCMVCKAFGRDVHTKAPSVSKVTAASLASARKAGKRRASSATAGSVSSESTDSSVADPLTSLSANNWKPDFDLDQAKARAASDTFAQHLRFANGTGPVDRAVMREPRTRRAMGLFSETMGPSFITIASYLSPKEVVRASLTCRGLYVACDDGILWRHMYHARHQTRGVTPTGNDMVTGSYWRQMMALEMNNQLQEQRCYFSKVALHEDPSLILGIPITYTTNPRTGQVDYIHSTFDTLSFSAFEQSGVTRTVWNSKFSAWLPLYLTKDHFDRAYKLMPRICARLNPASRGRGFDPVDAMDIICKLMNTQIVLLADRGVYASEAAIDGYCKLLRVLLALQDRSPVIRREIQTRVRGFLADPVLRTKRECRNIGQLLPLFGVCQGVTWNQAVAPVLAESFDRNVLWMCKKYGHLAKLKAPLAGQQASLKLLDDAFDATRVSMRLFMFHAMFLRHIAKPADGSTGTEVAARLDMLWGTVPVHLKNVLRSQIDDILEIKSWPLFFRAVGLKVPTPTRLQTMLAAAIQRSLEKGYHTKTTRFNSVHRSGTSSILLKGESFSADPNMSVAVLDESWRWQRHQGTQYLDASCLLFGWDNRHLQTVDYSRTRSTDADLGPAIMPRRRYAAATASESAVASSLATEGMFQGRRLGEQSVQHSGDVIRDDVGEGRHTMVLNLHRIGELVKAVFITLSGWTCTLRDIRQANVRFVDGSTGMELCTYNLDETDTGTYTCAIMCKLIRTRPGQPWTVVTIGELCSGRAGTYDPIIRACQRNLEG